MSFQITEGKRSSDRSISRNVFPLIIPVVVLLALRFSLPAYICDDAFISFKMALNLVQHNELVFNLGERVYLSTSPLWVLALAVGRLATSDIVLVAKALGILSEVAFMIAIAYLGYLLTNSRFTGMLAALFICTNPVYLLTSFSGMELSLYLFLTILAFILLAQERYTLSLLVAAIAVWSRFDALLVYVVVFGWTILKEGRTFVRIPRRALYTVAPSISLLIAYVLYGLIYYGSAVPAGFRVKAGFGPKPFSLTWERGVLDLSLQFINVFRGTLSYWYTAKTPFAILAIPLALGLLRLAVNKKKCFIPIISYAAFYAYAFIVTGNIYARNFPWYFVPVLPALYLLAAWGVDWILCGAFRGYLFALGRRQNGVAGEQMQQDGESPCFEGPTQAVIFSKPGTQNDKVGGPTEIGMLLSINAGVFALLIVLWLLVALGPMQEDARSLGMISSGREQRYASISVWLGRHLDERSVIAAREIGAIGFFSSPNVSVLDLAGLTRVKEERSTDWVDMLEKHKPEAIVMGVHSKPPPARCSDFACVEKEYEWEQFGKYRIGLRQDLAPVLCTEFCELENVYESIDPAREYLWESASWRRMK